jgi:hypothetical protein
MVAPLTVKPKRKTETLAKAPPTIVSRLEEDDALKKWPKPRLGCANGILETKANDGRTAAKATAPRTTQISRRRPHRTQTTKNLNLRGNFTLPFYYNAPLGQKICTNRQRKMMVGQSRATVVAGPGLHDSQFSVAEPGLYPTAMQFPGIMGSPILASSYVVSSPTSPHTSLCSLYSHKWC